MQSQPCAKRTKTKENSVDSNTSVVSSSSSTVSSGVSASSGAGSGSNNKRQAAGTETGRGTAENETATTTAAGRCAADLSEAVAKSGRGAGGGGAGGFGESREKEEREEKPKEQLTKGHGPLNATHLHLTNCLRTVQKLAIELDSDVDVKASSEANASSAVMSETGCRHYQSYVKEHSYDTFRVIDAYFAACVNRDAREKKVRMNERNSAGGAKGVGVGKLAREQKGLRGFFGERGGVQR